MVLLVAIAFASITSTGAFAQVFNPATVAPTQLGPNDLGPTPLGPTLLEATPLGATTVPPPVTLPAAGVSITSPTNGSTLFTNFELALSATPSSGKIVHQGTVVPRPVISPQNSLTTSVTVSYSNTGVAASGTLMLKDNGVTVGTLALSDFAESASTSFSVTLGLGAHTLLGTLSLSNSAGSSSSSSTISISVSSSISSLTSVSFMVSGPATASYSGKLTYQLTASDGTVIAQGVLADSAQSFSSLGLPNSVSVGQSLLLQEPIKVFVTGSGGTITVTVSVTANDHTNTALVTFTGQP